MSPVTHFFAGWLLASVSPTGRPTTLTRREKALVVAAAVAPDIDGIGIVPELLTRNTSHPLLWFSQYHHSLHTLAFALACTLAAYIVAGHFHSTYYTNRSASWRVPLPPISSRDRWPG
jgi:inner membrane protein